jgi:hypothetical protein
VKFRIIGDLEFVETIAEGCAIRELARLIEKFGKGRWRKRKAIAHLLFEDGQRRIAELHWYEAHGIGKRKMKVNITSTDYGQNEASRDLYRH